MTPRPWALEARGGAYDGWTAETMTDPGEHLVLWRCVEDGVHCDGHGTFDAADPDIVLRTAEVYKRTELDSAARTALYELPGTPTGPEVEERTLVGAGAQVGPVPFAFPDNRPYKTFQVP